ncbi:MAG: hypothetical protein ACYC6G_14380, partial [Desulfobaccales bacterium]
IPGIERPGQHSPGNGSPEEKFRRHAHIDSGQRHNSDPWALDITKTVNHRVNVYTPGIFAVVLFSEKYESV